MYLLLTLCQVRLGENRLVVSKMPKKGVPMTGFEPATLRCQRCGGDEDVGMQNCFSRRDNVIVFDKNKKVEI